MLKSLASEFCTKSDQASLLALYLSFHSSDADGMRAYMTFTVSSVLKKALIKADSGGQTCCAIINE